MPARPLKFTRYCLTQRISKLTGSKPVLKMTAQLKNKLHAGPVNILPNFWHYIGIKQNKTKNKTKQTKTRRDLFKKKD